MYKKFPSRGSSTFRAVGTGLSKKGYIFGFYFRYFHGKKGACLRRHAWKCRAYYIYLFTRRRELNDDYCDILLSYSDNGCAAIRAVARVAHYIINTTKCATAASCCSTRAPDTDDVINLAADYYYYILHTYALIHATASRAERRLL